MANVNGKNFRHEDCVLNNTVMPYVCGSPNFCHDCLQMGYSIEQNGVFRKILATVHRADKKKMIGGLSYDVVQRYSNGNQFTITHSVRNMF